MQNSSGSSTISATVPTEIIKESRIQPVWHVIVLNVLTLCFYAPIWFFKNARDLSNRLKFSSESNLATSAASDINNSKKLKDTVNDKSNKKEHKLNSKQSSATEPCLTTNPGSEASGLAGLANSATGQQPARIAVRDSNYENLALLSSREKVVLDLVKRVPPLFIVMGMALPVINFFLGMYFFKMLAELEPDTSSLTRKQPLLAGATLAALLIGALCLFKLPKIYYLLYCPAVCLPLSIAQHWLNDYWQSVELDKELLVRHSFSTIELVMLIFGITLLGLIIAGFSIVPFEIQR